MWVEGAATLELIRRIQAARLLRQLIEAMSSVWVADALCHNDLRLDNILYTPRRSRPVLTLVDWGALPGRLVGMGRGLRHGQLCRALGCPRIQSHAAHHGGLAAPTPRHGRGVRSHFGGSRRPRCDHRVPPRRGPPPAICARIQPAVEADHARVGGAARTCHELRKAATRMLGSHPRTAMGGTGWRDRPRICTWRSSGARLKGCRLPTGRHRGSANTSPDRGMALPPLAARSLPASCTTASIPFPSRSRSGNMRRALATPADASLARALQSANPGTGRRQGGWIYTGDLPDGESIVATKGGLSVAVPVAVLPSKSRPLTVGETVEVMMPAGSSARSPGYYVAHSVCELDYLRPLARLYLNVSPTGAPPLMNRLCTALNEAGLAFDLKAADDPTQYYRCDSMVLYVPRKVFALVLSLVHRVIDGLTGLDWASGPRLRLSSPAWAGSGRRPGEWRELWDGPVPNDRERHSGGPCRGGPVRATRRDPRRVQPSRDGPAAAVPRRRTRGHLRWVTLRSTTRPHRGSSLPSPGRRSSTTVWLCGSDGGLRPGRPVGERSARRSTTAPAGLALGFAKYGHESGESWALDMARMAITHALDHVEIVSGVSRNGYYSGRAGILHAALMLSRSGACDDPKLVTKARDILAAIAADPVSRATTWFPAHRAAWPDSRYR